MAKLPISQVKPGDKITQNVYTSLGSVLFFKGKVILQRDLEILQAFLIEHVTVERVEDLMKSKDVVEQEEDNEESPISQAFEIEYENMVSLLKRKAQSATTTGLPILELRTQMETLISQISHYNVLTFTPKHMKEQDYMFHNAVLTALTSYLLAKWLGMEQREWMQVAFAGLFHDIGNMKIDPDVLFKPSALTREETDEIKRHTTYGYNILKGIASINEGVKLTALQHHEKVDGSGYPLGVKADRIHNYAKIVAVADIFHAMTLNRTFKKAQSPYLVLEQLATESFGKLDAGYVQTFINKVTQFHNGSIVRLNDGRMGEIVFSDRNHPTRPWVSVEGQIVNLVTDRSLFIQEMLWK